MFSIKFNFNEEVRRVQIAKENGGLSFIQLCQTLRNIYPEIRNKQISLLYKDDEGDSVTVSSDEELAESIRVMESNADSGAKPLRYSVRTTVGEVSHIEAPSNTTPEAVKKLVYHNGVRCDECGMVPIAGTRFKCTTRENFDLCAKCEARKTQPYPMIKIEDPDHAPESLLYAYKDKTIEESLRFGTMPGRGHLGGRGGRGGGRGPPPHHHHGPPPGFHQNAFGPLHGGHHHGPHRHPHDHGPFHQHPHGPPSFFQPSAGLWNPFGTRAWNAEKLPTASPVTPLTAVPVSAPERNEPRGDGGLRAEAAPFVHGMDSAVRSSNSSVTSGGSGSGNYSAAPRSHYSCVDIPVSELNQFITSVTHTASDISSRGGDTHMDEELLQEQEEDPDSDSELQRAIRESFADMKLATHPSTCSSVKSGSGAPAFISVPSQGQQQNEENDGIGAEDVYDEDAHLAAAIEFTAPVFESQQLPPLHNNHQQQQQSLLSPGASQMMGISSLTNSFASNFGNNSSSTFVFPATAGASNPNGSLSSAVSISSLPKKYEMRFVRDITYPNGTMVQAGAVFKKIWRIRNDGLYDYPEHVTLAFAGGDVLGDVTVHESVPELKVGEECEVSTTLTAPEHAGRYVTNFRMETKDEVKFGQRLYANIQVVDEESDWHMVRSSVLDTLGDTQDSTQNTQDGSAVDEDEAGDDEQQQQDDQVEEADEAESVTSPSSLEPSTVLNCSVISTSNEDPSDVFYACRKSKSLSADGEAVSPPAAAEEIKRSEPGVSTAVETAADTPKVEEIAAAEEEADEAGDIDDEASFHSVMSSLAEAQVHVEEPPTALVHVPVEPVEVPDDSDFAADVALIDAAFEAQERKDREAAELALAAERAILEEEEEVERQADVQAERAAMEAEAREAAQAYQEAARIAEEAALAEEAAEAAEVERVAAEAAAREEAQQAELAASLNNQAPPPAPVPAPAPATALAANGNGDPYANSLPVLWGCELQLLSDMGFDDNDVLIPLLQTHVGTPFSLRGGEMNVEGLQRVVATLLNSFGMLR